MTGVMTSKGQVKEWSNARGAGKLFSVDLLDEHGCGVWTDWRVGCSGECVCLSGRCRPPHVAARRRLARRRRDSGGCRAASHSSVLRCPTLTQP